MDPVAFKGQNFMLTSTEDAIGELPCYHDEKAGMWMSCWKPSEKEMQEIVTTGAVWLFVYASSHPPVGLTGHDTRSKEVESS